MATIKVEVTYDPKKETLSQALASLLTEKPEHTEITAQMSLFDNPAPTETPTAQASTEAPQESPAESAPETPDTKPAEAKTISTSDAKIYAAAGMGDVDPLAVAGVREALQSGLRQTSGIFRNLTRTTANTAAKQFEDALDRAWLQVTSGAFDYNTAIRNAVKDLARTGVQSITYPSSHVDTIETAVRRAVVTGVNQTAAKSQLALMDELDIDLVEVTAHAGARPSHQEWQGQIYCRKGSHPKYKNFEEATGYGTGDGLCGWNCNHSFFPYVEGAPRTYSKAQLKDYSAKNITYDGQQLTEYEALQQQRYIERGIRRWKREEAAMKAAGQPTDEARAKVRAWQARQRDFIKQTGLKRDSSREQIG